MCEVIHNRIASLPIPNPNPNKLAVFFHQYHHHHCHDRGDLISYQYENLFTI